MTSMKVNNIVPTTNSFEQLKQLARSGSIASQIKRVSRNLDEATAINFNNDIVQNAETFPNQVHESPRVRAMRLLDSV